MEQMQILLAILVLLPFVSALLLALCGSDRMRRLIVYGSAGVLMISAVAFAGGEFAAALFTERRDH